MYSCTRKKETEVTNNRIHYTSTFVLGNTVTNRTTYLTLLQRYPVSVTHFLYFRSTSRKGHAAEVGPSKAKKNKKPTKPCSSTAELFSSESEEEEEAATAPAPRQSSAILSYITERRQNGHFTRQSNPQKKGAHLLEIRVYNCDEIEYVEPINRWRHAVLTIKNRTDVGTEAWRHLSHFISSTKKEYSSHPPVFIN